MDADGDTIDTTASRYVSGYLATLYLSELSARYLYDGESSVKTVDGLPVADANMLRNGLNSLLKWMHEGSTLDDLINSLSPKDEDGKPVYADTAEFEQKFIKGTKREDNTWTGDEDSLEFVNSFLNYMLRLDSDLPTDHHPNGSILFDFDQDYTSPLDTGKESSSEFLKVVNTNRYVKSTVKSDSIDIGAGKSDPTKAKDDAEEANDTQLAAAAKATTAAKPKQTARKSKAADKATATDVSAADDKSTSGNTAAAGDADAAGTKDTATSRNASEDGAATEKNVAADNNEATTTTTTNANATDGSADFTDVGQTGYVDGDAAPAEGAASYGPATYPSDPESSPAPEPTAYEEAPSPTPEPEPSEPAQSEPAPTEPEQEATAEE
jgi:hypothetical protein